MAYRVTKGPRIPVKLPFAEGDAIVRMKQDVAEYFGFQLEAQPTVTITRRGNTYRIPKRGGYRQRSFKLTFTRPQRISGKQFNSVSIPVPPRTKVEAVLRYFRGNTNKRVAIVTTDKGESYIVQQMERR